MVILICIVVVLLSSSVTKDITFPSLNEKVLKTPKMGKNLVYIIPKLWYF
jgi:hypothetical protein